MEENRIKCCGNCRWHTKEALTDDWLCDNEESDNCMDYTEFHDICESWEAR